MLPLILVAVGAYLIGDSVLEDKKYAKGGKTQGYDDKKDESLAMKDGKISKKDLDSTHARRDDARFEERGKMEHGGEMAKGGDVEDKKMIAKLKKQFDKKYQGSDFDFDKDDNFKVDGYNVEVFDWKEEDEMNDYIAMNSKDNYLVPYSSDDDNYYLIIVPKDKMAKGGKVMTDKQTIAKLKKQFDKKYQGSDFDFDKDDNFKVDGYNVEVFDWKEEDEMNDYIAMNSKDNYLVPYSSDDDNYYLIIVPKDKMAKGGEMDDAYRKKLENHIYKTSLSKYVNGFKLVKEGWGNYGFLLWVNKKMPEIEIYATPFYTPENAIIFEEVVNGEDVRRQVKSYKLTGDLDKDAQTYFEFLESKTKKYAKGKMEHGGNMAKGGKLVGKQKNLDVNKNGKLDAEDFKMLRKGKK
jgi:hypothetical protein